MGELHLKLESLRAACCLLVCCVAYKLMHVRLSSLRFVGLSWVCGDRHSVLTLVSLRITNERCRQKSCRNFLFRRSIEYNASLAPDRDSRTDGECMRN